MKKVTSMLIILSIIISLCTFVNAASTEATISEGSRNGNTVTFTITVPDKTGLRGDANNDGKVDTLDSSKLIEYNLGKITLADLNEFNADYDCNGIVELTDSTELSNMLLLNWKPVTLTGTLAANSKSEFKKVSETSYTVTVTVPENTDGTIGVKLNEGIFKYSTKDTTGNFQTNKAISSKELSITKTTPAADDKKTEDPKQEGNQNVSTDKTITIADGKQDKNKITFAITLPKGIGLLGDVNNDGKIDDTDHELLIKYNEGLIKASDINMLNADVDPNGAVELSDATGLQKMLNSGIKVITLNGTLAATSTYQLVRGTDGNYSVIVTVPTDKEGTIGVTLNKGTVIFADHKTNEAITSKEFKVTLDSLKGTTSDAKDTKNETKDAASTYNKLPAAGRETIIISTIALIAIGAVIGYVKYKRIDK